ncbi:hypothetical protein AVEN_9893-1, partial [Araneus ventricosus]
LIAQADDRAHNLLPSIHIPQSSYVVIHLMSQKNMPSKGTHPFAIPTVRDCSRALRRKIANPSRTINHRLSVADVGGMSLETLWNTPRVEDLTV